MDISSKVNVKKYFLPVYVIWALIIPTTLLLLNAYRLSPDNSNFIEIFDYILWNRVPAMYALYGLIYPLTIVTFYGFYKSFTVEQGFTSLSDAWTNMSNSSEVIAYRAERSVIMLIFLLIIWIGPVLHLLITFIYHKRMVSYKVDKKVGWIDYLYGFI